MAATMIGGTDAVFVQTDHDNGDTTFAASFYYGGSHWRLQWSGYGWTEAHSTYCRDQVSDWPRQHIPVFGLAPPFLERIGAVVGYGPRRAK